jgi:hypothetical protein
MNKLRIHPTTLLLSFALVLLASVVATNAYAQVPPEGDAVQSFLALIANWKVLGPVGIGSGIIVVLLQVLKSPTMGSWFKNVEYKRIVITVFGQIYGVLFLIQSGQSVINSIVVGLFASGGAVAIWEAVKPLVEKKK